MKTRSSALYCSSRLAVTGSTPRSTVTSIESGSVPGGSNRVMGTFTRRVYLSEHLDAEAIEAAYDNGVLGVRIPVLERAKPRKVEIHKPADTHKAIKS